MIDFLDFDYIMQWKVDYQRLASSKWLNAAKLISMGQESSLEVAKRPHPVVVEEIYFY